LFHKPYNCTSIVYVISTWYMKKLFFISALVISLNTYAQQKQSIPDLVQYVNPLMGSDSKYELSNGNTYPAIALPWGMNTWTPQTGKMGDGWQYTYAANKINGFKETHQPSPWMNDYGQFAIMPVTGHLKVSQNGRASWFSHKAEIVKPYYYNVYLADHDVTAEISPTERTAQFRFTYPKNDSSYIIVDAFDKGSFVKVIPSEQKIIGYSTKYARGPLKNFKDYLLFIAIRPLPSPTPTATPLKRILYRFMPNTRWRLSALKQCVVNKFI